MRLSSPLVARESGPIRRVVDVLSRQTALHPKADERRKGVETNVASRREIVKRLKCERVRGRSFSKEKITVSDLLGTREPLIAYGRFMLQKESH